MVEDLQAAIATPEVQRYESIYLVGFSLGGHMVMRYALDPDPAVRAVAAVCAPLDLRASCHHIDLAPQKVYRRHLLTGLKAGACAVESRRSVRLAKIDLQSIDLIRDWDELVVAPRFGFRDANDYYEKASVGPYVDQLAIPSLFVFAERDPMVSRKCVMPSLQSLPSHSDVRWLKGGHVYFPNNRRVMNEVFNWIQSRT
jgi:predicted alpha/beta-fold hydrolase